VAPEEYLVTSLITARVCDQGVGGLVSDGREILNHKHEAHEDCCSGLEKVLVGLVPFVVRTQSVPLRVEAPARQGARSAHTGRVQVTSNAARRDASAFRMETLFFSGPL
jgi:hypothetical protein